MEPLHGIIEWIPLALFALAGFPLDRWVAARRQRYWFYVLLLLTAIIFDLNKAVFRSDIVNALFYTALLAALSEFFWIAVRKRSRLLLCGALALFTPAFVYVYFALLMIVPMPCHENQREALGGHECGGKSYTMERRLSFDVFKPARVYTLNRGVWGNLLEKQVDKYPSPKGYMEAQFEPRWRCLDGGAAVDLYIDGYTLWSLKEKNIGE